MADIKLNTMYEIKDVNQQLKVTDIDKENDIYTYTLYYNKELTDEFTMDGYNFRYNQSVLEEIEE